MRAFIATRLSLDFSNELIRVSEYLKKELCCLPAKYGNQYQLSFARAGKIKWVKPENLHITYAFLGDIQPDKRENIIARMKAVRVDKFIISAGNLGCFFAQGKPKTIWLGINEGADKLEEAAKKLKANLAIDGFVFENKFFPHITLGRIRGYNEEMSGENINGVFSQALKLIDGKLSFAALNVELFESISDSCGQIYKSLYKMELV
ncbi:MAG: RNA 2',3'-cyclic phosphodiesterase [Elusimicrobia bacterium]|nr:RNA 2',3'-cyclic phosphodiesterase [Elusimicrobiota bacterium]